MITLNAQQGTYSHSPVESSEAERDRLRRTDLTYVEQKVLNAIAHNPGMVIKAPAQNWSTVRSLKTMLNTHSVRELNRVVDRLTEVGLVDQIRPPFSPKRSPLRLYYWRQILSQAGKGSGERSIKGRVTCPEYQFQPTQQSAPSRLPRMVHNRTDKELEQERTVLEILEEFSAATLAEAAQHTKYTHSTAGAAINRLLAMGVVEKAIGLKDQVTGGKSCTTYRVVQPDERVFRVGDYVVELPTSMSERCGWIIDIQKNPSYPTALRMKVEWEKGRIQSFSSADILVRIPDRNAIKREDDDCDRKLLEDLKANRKFW